MLVVSAVHALVRVFGRTVSGRRIVVLRFLKYIESLAKSASALGGQRMLNNIDLLRKPQEVKPVLQNAEIDEDFLLLDQIDNILDLEEDRYPRFTLAKNSSFIV